MAEAKVLSQVALKGNSLTDNGTAAERKFFRDMDKKAALSEAEKFRKATLKKTEKLRALRLEKEAAERAEQAKNPKKPPRKRTAKKKRSD